MSGTRNKISDVKDHLIMALERLNDIDINKKQDQEILKLELQRSKEIANVATAITNIAKVEVEYIEVLQKHGGSMKSDFFEISDKTPKLTDTEQRLLNKENRNTPGN